MIDDVPKKELGQHWLHDASVLDEIVKNADVASGDLVLEIGPGLGTLTEKLLETGARVVALEFDEVLAESLERRLTERGCDVSGLSVQQGDIRKYDFAALGGEYKIVANIPYYLTSYLMRSLSDTSAKPAECALLMQKEVAERVASSTKRSLLSVITQYHYDVTQGVFVGRELFTPPPKVDSQVLCMKRRQRVAFPADERRLLRLFKAAFSEKRKNIKNALSGGLSLPKDVVAELLIRSGIPENRRAESLAWDEWAKLYMAYSTLT